VLTLQPQAQSFATVDDVVHDPALLAEGVVERLREGALVLYQQQSPDLTNSSLTTLPVLRGLSAMCL
ncbi:MAG TPA: hypothetical protein VLQ78_01615, partial [Ornithinibacter sp.]|nr:hypothetical protein [Ornithinibacter sp.]